MHSFFFEPSGLRVPATDCKHRSQATARQAVRFLFGALAMVSMYCGKKGKFRVQEQRHRSGRASPL